MYGLRYAELHAQRHFLPISGFGGNGFLHIPVEGVGINRGGEFAAVGFHLGAIAVRLGMFNGVPGGFKYNGGRLLSEF